MKTILIVDDEIDILDVIKGRLESRNYQVLTAENGKLGVEAAQKQTPDLILMDIMMPVMDGIEAYQNLRNNHTTKNIPVIFLTSLISKEEEEMLIARLGEPYVKMIAKPFEGEQVIQEIVEIIGPSQG